MTKERKREKERGRKVAAADDKDRLQPASQLMANSDNSQLRAYVPSQLGANQRERRHIPRDCVIREAGWTYAMASLYANQWQHYYRWPSLVANGGYRDGLSPRLGQIGFQSVSHRQLSKLQTQGAILTSEEILPPKAFSLQLAVAVVVTGATVKQARRRTRQAAFSRKKERKPTD